MTLDGGPGNEDGGDFWIEVGRENNVRSAPISALMHCVDLIQSADNRGQHDVGQTGDLKARIAGRTRCLSLVDRPSVSDMVSAMEITFQVEPCNETGGFVARWDDPQGGGITTQGDTLADLQSMVADAVSGYFEAGQVPAKVRLHFRQDPLGAVA